ncbi:MAG TPA: HEAT repeat domain-containing protein [Candidatus Edwardsbacteria bacterium]|nr:HEAT repeat domain-containing protein [Candidatus Edwardsbacteria bacterium]
MNDSAIVEIVEQFKSRDITRRMAAVSRAAEHRGPEAIALLVKALQDQSPSLREHAVAAICLAGPAATAPLLRLLGGGVWFARAAAARVLERIGTAEALAPLLRQCGDANRSVAQAAGQAVNAVVARCGQDAALRQLLAMRGEERHQCASAFALLQPELAQQLALVPAEAVAETAAADQASQQRAGECLQDLRKAVRTALKQDVRDEDEEP